MGRNIVYGITLVIILMAAGAEGAQEFQRSDAVERMTTGTINWTTGEVYARGIGSPPASAMNAAQARAMAARAAQAVAYRNLLQTVKGVRIDSVTMVDAVMVKSDVIKTRIEGIVKGARTLKTRYLSDGSVEVLVVMPMKGAFISAVIPDDFGSSAVPPLPKKPAPVLPKPPDTKPTPPVPEPSRPVPSQEPEPPTPAPRPEPAVPSTDHRGTATGLVIDGRGLDLKPALVPKIVDREGREIYVGRIVTRTNAVEQGVAGYAKDVNAAANNFRVTDNPVVMKGVRAVGASRTDVMLGEDDARTLRTYGNTADFLQYCRVIIVY